jgi:hypothetical protein
VRGKPAQPAIALHARNRRSPLAEQANSCTLRPLSPRLRLEPAAGEASRVRGSAVIALAGDLLVL